MKSTSLTRKIASNILTPTTRLYTLPVLLFAMQASSAWAKNRCEADLSRTYNAFCLADSHVESKTPLTYSWKLNDNAFDLSSKACLETGADAGQRRDMIIAIDRSQNLWAVDSSGRKLGVDNLSIARYVIGKLQQEAQANPEKAPKIGVVMFSVEKNCAVYNGGAIAVDRTFPCLYMPAQTVADADHVKDLLAFLDAAKGLYSQGTHKSSDFTVVSDLLMKEPLGLTSATQAGLMLMSDARSFDGATGDKEYAALRTGSYAKAQSNALAQFAKDKMRRFKVVFGMNPLTTPTFGKLYQAQFENMCHPQGGAGTAADCDSSKVTYGQPETWPVNKLDFRAFAVKLVALSSGAASDVAELNSAIAIDPLLESLRQGSGLGVIDAVAYSIDGGQSQAGTVNGGRVIIENLPASATLKLDLLIKVGGAQRRIPMTVSTQVIANDGKEFLDNEMLCSAEAPAAGNPNLDLKNLQGGSGSCGVISLSVENAKKSAVGLIILLIMPVFMAFARHQAFKSFLVLLLALGFTAAGTARAKEGEGLNALQYRPVVDGVGTADKASVLTPGSVHAGIFMDYANDSVELSGEDNKRLDSVMDDLVTAHAVLGLGLMERLALGIHIPYVHKSDMDRAVEGDEVEGGQLGRPSDVSVQIKASLVKRSNWALGLMPVVTVPTGDPELLLGDGSSNYGALFLLSGVSGPLSWATNLGYMQRQKPLQLSDDRANSVIVRGQILSYAGAEYSLTRLISVAGNLQMKMSAGDGLGFSRSNPAEWMASTKVKPMAGLELQGGMGTGIGKGYGAPDYRIFAGVSYVPTPSYRRSVVAK